MPLAWTLLPILLLAGLAARAEENPTPRLAVVDLTAVFEAHPRTAEATAALTAARKAARQTFREKSEALKNTLQQHQELLRDGRREEAAAELEKANELERAIAELGTARPRSLRGDEERDGPRVRDDVARVVREFNAEKHYALVLDKSAASDNGLPQVLDSPGADDITAEIIARLKK